MGIESLSSIEVGSSETTPGIDERKLLCLRANLGASLSPNFDSERDAGVIKTLDRSITVGNDDAGRWALGCLQAGCDARCILVQHGNSIGVPDQRNLQQCIEPNR